MDWLRQIPIGQYVDGPDRWLRRLDPRLKLAWSLLFLLSPVLAGPGWRLSLVLALLLLTVVSGLPRRIWWRSMALLSLLAISVGLLSMLLPATDPPASLALRAPDELPGASADGLSWDLFRFGPLTVDRASLLLGVRTATLIFTVIHSVNLVLLSTPPEDLVWALTWFLTPLAWLGWPTERLGFQLLLALRFLPLVQEELQNLLRALASRAVNLRKLGFKASFGLLLAVGERLLANILLRAEQGADALLARGGQVLGPSALRWEDEPRAPGLNGLAALLLLGAVVLRVLYGAM